MNEQEIDNDLGEGLPETVIEEVIEQYALVLNEFVYNLHYPLLSLSEEEYLSKFNDEKKDDTIRSLNKVIEFASALELVDLCKKANDILSILQKEKKSF